MLSYLLIGFDSNFADKLYQMLISYLRYARREPAPALCYVLLFYWGKVVYYCVLADSFPNTAPKV